MQQTGRNELAEIAHLGLDLPLPQLVKILTHFISVIPFVHSEAFGNGHSLIRPWAAVTVLIDRRLSPVMLN
jgi:hypothetical protein